MTSPGIEHDLAMNFGMRIVQIEAQKSLVTAEATDELRMFGVDKMEKDHPVVQWWKTSELGQSIRVIRSSTPASHRTCGFVRFGG